MEGGPPRFPPGFTCPAVLRYHNAQPDRFCLRGSNPVSQAFPDLSTTAPVSYCAQDRQILYVWPYNTDGANPAGHRRTSVWPHPRSLAATGGISVDFSSSAYLDVSVRRVVPRRPMGSAGGRQASLPAGFAHSEIRGSQAMCASPRLIAACHVLRRLPVPRHPPCAFSILPAPRAGARGARFLNAGVLSCAVAHTRAPGRGPGDQMRPLPLGGRGLLRVLCGSQGAEGRALGTGCRGASGARGDGGPPAGRARLRELR